MSSTWDQLRSQIDAAHSARMVNLASLGDVAPEPRLCVVHDQFCRCRACKPALRAGETPRGYQMRQRCGLAAAVLVFSVILIGLFALAASIH